MSDAISRVTNRSSTQTQVKLLGLHRAQAIARHHLRPGLGARDLVFCVELDFDQPHPAVDILCNLSGIAKDLLSRACAPWMFQSITAQTKQLVEVAALMPNALLQIAVAAKLHALIPRLGFTLLRYYETLSDEPFSVLSDMTKDKLAHTLEVWRSWGASWRCEDCNLVKRSQQQGDT